ncbi:MAG: class I SAM-dependent methyltransferase [Thermodesulfovibrionales bacterium]|jgi:SAM-dependent methyltransferase
MMKTLNDYAKEWQANAEADALWVILTDSRYYGQRWNAEDFFATGEEEIARVFTFMESASVKAPTGCFLDFGCGVGRTSKAMRKRFERGFGIDISQKMIDLARSYVEGVDFMVNQSDSLSEFQDESIDFIYSHIVLQHIPNEYQKRYIEEFLRIIRPGGLAAFQIPIGLINHREMKTPFAYRGRQEIKRRLPFLIALKRWLIPPKQFHYDFRIEMHPLGDNEIRSICEKRGCVIEAAPATNSCEADHNGKVEYYDLAEHKKELDQCVTRNHYLSCMFFVRKPGSSVTTSV